MNIFKRTPSFNNVKQLFSDRFFEKDLSEFNIIAYNNFLNREGIKVTDNLIELENFECELFNYLIIKEFDGQSSKNYEFFQPVFRTTLIPDMTKLIHNLTQIYGADDLGNKYLNPLDKQELKNGEFWTGRAYMKDDKISCFLNFPEDNNWFEDTLSFSILHLP